MGTTRNMIKVIVFFCIQYISAYEKADRQKTRHGVTDATFLTNKKRNRHECKRACQYHEPLKFGKHWMIDSSFVWTCGLIASMLLDGVQRC